jgi:hypothetical protein
MTQLRLHLQSIRGDLGGPARFPAWQSTIAVIIAAIWRTMHETDAEAPGIPGAVRKQELREEVEGAARKQDALPLQNANDAI